MSVYSNIIGILNSTGLFEIGKSYTKPTLPIHASPKKYTDDEVQKGILRKTVSPETEITIPSGSQMIRYDSFCIDGDLIIEEDAELLIL